MQDSPLPILSEHFQSAAEWMEFYPVPAALIDTTGVIIYLNQRFAHLYQVPLLQMQNSKLEKFSDAAAKNFQNYVTNFRKDTAQCIYEEHIQEHYFQINLTPILNHQHKMIAVLGVEWDISKIKRTQQYHQQMFLQYKEKLQYDSLTGVNNEQVLEDEIQYLKQEQKNILLSVLLLDVDHFDGYNQEYGFNQANTALYKISQQLKLELRQDKDCLVKVARDRFFIFFPLVNQMTAFTIAERLRQSIFNLNIPYQQGIEDRLTLSIVMHTLHLFELKSLHHLILHLGDQLKKYKKRNRNDCYTLSDTPHVIVEQQ